MVPNCHKNIMQQILEISKQDTKTKKIINSNKTPATTEGFPLTKQLFNKIRPFPIRWILKYY